MISNLINFGMLLIALISLYFSYSNWQKVKNKITMINEAGEALEILPAWYTSRMMTDHWAFGLLTTDGRTLVINRVLSVSDDGKWMDVFHATTILKITDGR